MLDGSINKLLWKIAELVRQTQVSQLDNHDEFCEDRLKIIATLLGGSGFDPLASREHLNESEWRPLIEIHGTLFQ